MWLKERGEVLQSSCIGGSVQKPNVIAEAAARARSTFFEITETGNADHNIT
jgi:hypothetical protein